MRIEPLTAAHLRGARAHPKQARHQGLLEGALPGSLAWAAVLPDGEVAAIGGLCEVRGDRAGWLLFTDRITPAGFLVVWRAARRAVAAAREMGEGFIVHVDPDYPEAPRLARLLGLVPDGDEEIEGRVFMRMRAR